MEHLELVDRIYSEVKQMIFDQRLKPGEKIIQEKISAQLGISRSPLLKVLQRLQNEMLVESIPRRGMFVKSIDINELIDIFECRAVLEGLSAKLTTEHIDASQIQKLKACFEPFVGNENIDSEIYADADRKFHAYILEWSGNKVIAQLEMLSNVHLKAFQAGLLRKPEQTLKEHLAIITAMEEKDAEKAEAHMRNHILKSLEAFRAKNTGTA